LIPNQGETAARSNLVQEHLRSHATENVLINDPTIEPDIQLTILHVDSFFESKKLTEFDFEFAFRPQSRSNYYFSGQIQKWTLDIDIARRLRRTCQAGVDAHDSRGSLPVVFQNEKDGERPPKRHGLQKKSRGREISCVADRAAENVVVKAIIEPELEPCNVEMQVLLANVVESANDPALDDRHSIVFV
jgi:hypothetical protein